ncbi:MAG: V-type ATP synthase subunit D [Candidatus Omnitrophica bacterium]|nr:V-type ATP synthase subunit D [Candidatus Omnitrophota bacterium]
MIMSVKPNRMELLKLKRRIAIARRGHKLLKDKQDELMRKFMSTIEDTKSLRFEVEKALKEIFIDFIEARSVNSAGLIDEQLAARKAVLEVAYSTERFLNLGLTGFAIKNIPAEPEYSFFTTTSSLDRALANFRGILSKLVALAQAESRIKLLAEEIKKTRRRVNALEYILIPNLIDTVRYINMKLAEFERSSLTRLMRVKEQIKIA